MSSRVIWTGCVQSHNQKREIIGLGNSESCLKETDHQECSKLSRYYKDHRLHRTDVLGVTEVLLAAKNLHAEKIRTEWEVSKWKHICKNLLKHDKKRGKTSRQTGLACSRHHRKNFSPPPFDPNYYIPQKISTSLLHQTI